MPRLWDYFVPGKGSFLQSCSVSGELRAGNNPGAWPPGPGSPSSAFLCLDCGFIFSALLHLSLCRCSLQLALLAPDCEHGLAWGGRPG